MMMKKYRFIILVPFILMGGCSSEDNETPEKSDKVPLFNDQLKALEKAKGVEQILQKGLDARRQTMDESGT